MQKWEYCTLFVASDGRITLMDADGSRDVQEKVSNPMAAMDVLGATRWELVSAIGGGTDTSDFVHQFYFKRPKP